MKFRDRLYRLYDREDWVGARKLIRTDMKTEDPNVHWLMAKMAQTYHCEHKYTRALAWARRALDIRPRCPIARWEQAVVLSDLGRHAEAARVLRVLIRRPVSSYLDAGACSQSKAWVRTYITDCYHQLAWEEWKRGRLEEGLKAQRQHLRRRLRGSKHQIGDTLAETRVGIREAVAIIREKRGRRKR